MTAGCEGALGSRRAGPEAAGTGKEMQSTATTALDINGGPESHG